MKMADVNDADKMAKYLRDRVTIRKRLFHYTSYEALLIMLDQKAFRLSLTDNLNDYNEKIFCGTNKYFIMSLTGEEESVAMWALYGPESEIKIRIDFSKAEFRKQFNEKNIFIDKELRTPYYVTDLKTKSCIVSDMAYFDDKKKKYKYNGKQFFKLNGTLKDEKIEGLVKYDVWEFEKETRARALALSDPDMPQYVYMALNEEIMNDIHVTLNPWISKQLKKELKESLRKRGISCSDSAHEGKIRKM